MDNIVFVLIIVSVILIAISVILIIWTYLRVKKKEGENRKSLIEKFNRIIKEKSEEAIFKGIIELKKITYFNEINSKNLNVCLILILQIVLLIVGGVIEYAAEEQLSKMEIAVYLDCVESNANQKILETKVIEKASKKFFEFLLFLGLAYLKILYNIGKKASDTLNEKKNEMILELEYHLYKLSKNNKQQLIIKLPDDDNVLKVEKILSSEQKLQINSYVWNRIIKK